MRSTTPTSGLAEAAGAGGESPSPIMRTLAVLGGHRTFIVRSVFAGVLSGVGITLLLPRHYTTTFSFIPQTAMDGGKSGLASLAGQFGVSIGGLPGQSTPPQLYADLLVTREILVPIATDSVPTGTSGAPRVRMPEFLSVRGDRPDEVIERTVAKLKDDVIGTSVAARTTGVVSVSVQTTSAAASLAIAERLLAGLNRFNVVTRQSQAAAERRFVEGRLNDAKRTLTEAENRMRAFLESNRATANSPGLTFEQERLRREVTNQQELVRSLTQQFEDARIREVRDTPVITVIDRPALAARADPRGGARITLGAATVAFILAVGWLLGRDRLQRELAAHGLASWRALLSPPRAGAIPPDA